MKIAQKFIFLPLVAHFISSFALAQSVDIFPEREVLHDRTQIKVTIANHSSEDILCESVQNFVIYRSQSTSNNIEENIPLLNIAIPANFSRRFVVGSDRTRRLRSGLYPDASMDVVNNDFLSSAAKCRVQPLEPLEKSKIIREESSFKMLLEHLTRTGQVRMTNDLHYPLVILAKADEGTIELQGYSQYPRPENEQVKWEIEINGDGALLVKFSTVGLWDQAVHERITPGSMKSKHYLEYLADQLPSFEETRPPGQGYREVRDMLIGIVAKNYRDQGFEKGPYKIIHSGQAITAPSYQANGQPLFLSTLGRDPHQNWSYVEHQLISHDGRCLAVKGDELNKDGGKVFLWECNGTPSQQWKIVGTKIYSSEGMCLDIPGNLPELGIQIWSCNDHEQQNWNFTKL